MQDAATADYESYQFHLVMQRSQAFCSEDLGAFYLDILKDRLYTCGADSRARRSAQTALYHITQSLVRLMAPILQLHRRGGLADIRRRRRQRLREDLARDPGREAGPGGVRQLGRRCGSCATS